MIPGPRVCVFFFRLEKFSPVTSSNVFSVAFSLILLLGPHNVNVSTLDIVPPISQTVLIFKKLFSVQLSGVTSTNSTFSSLIHSFVSSILLLIPSCEFLISVIVFIISGSVRNF